MENALGQGRVAQDVIAFCIGVALWLLYGILQQELPMILWNSVSLALALAILVMKFRFG